MQLYDNKQLLVEMLKCNSLLRITETVLKSVSKEKLTNFEKTNLTYEKTDKKKK